MKLRRILALLMVFTLCFSLAACSGGGDETTTESTTENTAPVINDGTDPATEPQTGDSTIPQTDINGSTIPQTQPQSGNNNDPTQPQSNNNDPTQPPAGVSFPVGGSATDVVNAYNKYANAMKQYNGKFSITVKEGTESTLTYFAVNLGFIKNAATKQLPNDWKDAKNETWTVTNGKASNGKSLSQIFPPDGESYTSKLTPNGASSAICTKDGDNFKIVIKLKEEKGTNINFTPPQHASCIDTLSITAEDLGDFTIKNENVKYTGATITAVFDNQGRIVSLNILEPVFITGNMGYKGTGSFEAHVDGAWHQIISCKY